jgi:NAD(P)-dependent dehydrogenase (short-subunit alcohol dehydrogenase family)
MPWTWWWAIVGASVNVQAQMGERMASVDRIASSARVVLITGATSGIGKACAERLAGAGWWVFGAGRGAGPMSAVDSRIEMITINVDEEASVQDGVAAVLAKAGRLDAVINNAGFSMRGAVEDCTIEEAKALFETNFFGVLRVCRATMPALRERGGCIINISSLSGIVGLPFTGLYSASKFALEGVSESLRLEALPWGIRVVLVEPGDFRTQIKAKRRIAATAQTSVYRSAFDHFMRRRDKYESVAPTPEPVACLVERILTDPNPKMRYTVGMFGQRIIAPLKRVLPQRAFEWFLRRMIGL